MKKITSLKAIRLKCLDCSAGSYKEVRECPCYEDNGSIQKCPLYPYRLGKRPKEKVNSTPIKAIRKYCLWCCGGSRKEVRECPVFDCPLWKFRFGKNPNYKKRVKDVFKNMFFSKKSLLL